MSEMLDRLRRTLSERYTMERQVGQGTAAAVYIAHEGESLRDRLEREKQLPLEDALRITRDIAGALFAEALSADHVPAPPAPAAGGVGGWWRALRNALRTDGGS